MRAMVTALTWEYWRRGWPSFLAALAYMIGLPALCVGAFRFKTQAHFPPDDFNTLLLHFAFVGVSLLGFGVAVFQAQNDRKDLCFPARLFALPVPAWLLVGCRILQGALTVALLFLVTALAYEGMFGLNWPVLGPVLFVATTFVCLEACFWALRDFRFWKLGLCAVCGAGMVFWLSERYTFRGLYEPAEFWERVTTGEVLTMFVCAVAAYAYSVYGLSRSRRGDAAGAAVLRLWIERIAGSFKLSDHHDGPQRALGSVLWLRCGVPFPAVLGSLGLLVFAGGLGYIAWGTATLGKTFETLCILLPMVTGFLALPFGLLLGQPSSFQATLPIDNRVWSRCLRRASARSVFAAWLTVAAFMVVCGGLVAAFEGVPAVLQAVDDLIVTKLGKSPLEGMAYGPSLIVVWLVLASWAGHGLSASAALAQTAWAPVAIVYAYVCLFVGLAIFDEAFIGPELARLLQMLVTGSLGVVCLAGTAWAMARAYRRQFLNLPTILVCSVLWIVLCATAAPPFIGDTQTPWSFRLMSYGLLALPFTPLATLPLAVLRSRHR